MSSGEFVFTPQPLVLNVIIKDSKAEGGRPFKYPEWEIDELRYRPYISEFYGPMFEPIKDALPKYACEFMSSRFIYLSGWRENDPNRYEASIRALSRLTAFIRKNVKEMGEFWYVKQWISTVPEKPEDMVIIEMNVDDLEYAGEEIDSFRFKVDTFYKFVDK